METDHYVHKLCFCYFAIGILLNLPDGLVVCTNRNEHSSRCFKLVDESFGKPIRRSTDMDSIIGP